MLSPRQSKTRELDRRTRTLGPWARVGFVIIVAGAVTAGLLLLLGAA